MNNCASNPQQVSVFVNQPSALVSNTNIISNSSCSGTHQLQWKLKYCFRRSPGILTTGQMELILFISLLFPGIYTVDIIDLMVV